MPRNSAAARRYVRALQVLIDEKSEGSAQKLLAELKGFQSTLKSSPEAAKFFFNPVIGKSDKKDALAEIKTKLPMTEKFLEALVEGNRINILDEIIEEFEGLLEADSGELSVQLETARALSESSLEEIKSLLRDRWKKKVKLNVTINPELMGGFVAKAKGRILDASVTNQFELLKQSLSA